LLIEVLKGGILAIGERIVERFIDGVIGIALGAVDLRDGMTSCASDPCLRRRVIHIVEIRIIEGAA